MVKKDKGFTLLELAMVLFIITLVLGGVLTPLSTRMEVEERKKTVEQLKDIKSSLIGYALVNGHLPCPDCPDNTVGSCGTVATGLGAGAINDGIEDGIIAAGPSPTNDRTTAFNFCATPEGNLPWVTLGVDEFDAWDNHFTYRVTDPGDNMTENSFADNDPGTGCGTATTGVSFEICSMGNINISDDPGATPGNVASNVPAIVISYGNNDGQRGASEAANQDGTTTFIQKGYTTGNTGDDFDDLLMWISTSTLIYRMVQAERLP